MGGLALSYVNAFTLEPRRPYLGARTVIAYFAQVGLVGIVAHPAITRYHSQTQLRRQHILQLLHGCRIIIGVLLLQSSCHKVRITAQAGRQQLLAVVYIAVMLENNQDNGKNNKECREIHQ